MVWMVGDPLQAQPVAAGGLAHWVADQTREGRVPVAELKVNRRQAHAVERQALTCFRAGRITDSQELRDDAGWEHHFDNRDGALEAMAAAVLVDIECYGSDRVAALAVSHSDCEALADRIRADLADQGAIVGPAIEGPGWSGPRQYQAGDHILLHALAALADGTRLTNGTVASVTAVTGAGLFVTTDGRADPVLLPGEFVTSRGADGRPQLSHSWVRTIDGVQGGTWDQVHLLATPALDRYRGYVGQSRSIQPTHTWNTRPKTLDDPGDHGGRLVQPYSTRAEQIAAALARAQPKTFAAVDDPHRYERWIRAEQALHQKHLDQRPPDVTDQVRRAEQEVAARERDLQDAQARLAHWQQQREQTAGLRGLTRSRRDQHHEAVYQAQFQAGVVERDAQRLDSARGEQQHLLRQQAAGVAFDQDHQWRHDRIGALEHQLELYWAKAVLDAARDGYPAAYGKHRLRTADTPSSTRSRPSPTDLPPASRTSQAIRSTTHPLRALADLDRAIVQAGERPGVTLVEPIKPHRHQMDPWPTDIHQQHMLHGQLYPTEGPSIGIDVFP